MTSTLSLSYAPQTRPDMLEVILHGGKREIGRIFFKCRTGHRLLACANALVSLGLYPAVELGAKLEVDGRVDPLLLSRVGEIADLFSSWWPACKLHGIRAATESETSAQRNSNVGLFFSGGVDSAFSLVTERQRITNLVTLLGADVPIDDPVATAFVEKQCHDAARAVGMEPIVIETNAKTVFQPFARWGEMHGSVLTAIGHMLTQHMGQVLIASSGNETIWNVPWGSHPRLDPLYSSRLVQFEHHGFVTRFDKIARVAADDFLLAQLRVCNQSHINCGSCAKCTYVLRSLDLINSQQRAKSFTARLEQRGQLKVLDDSYLTEIERLLEVSRQFNRIELAREFEQVIQRYGRSRMARNILEKYRTWKRIRRHRKRWQKAISGTML
jgi:hypothetical protein